MYICYIDEAGCTGALPHGNNDIQPVFILAGVFIKQTHILKISNDLSDLPSI